MSAADVVLLVVAVMWAALGWFFFGPRRARTARSTGGVRRAVAVGHTHGAAPTSDEVARWWP